MRKLTAGSGDSLVSPYIDGLLIGGLSMIVFVAIWLVVPPSLQPRELAWIMFALTFVVNSPHFLASYYLFYIENGLEVRSQLRFVFVGIVVPLILIAALLGAALSVNLYIFSGLINAMFFLVGWHYVKQVYGCVLVTAALRKFYFSKIESFVLKVNLFSLWGISYLQANIYLSKRSHHGIDYMTFDFPKWTYQAVLLLTVVSFWLLTIALAKRRMITKKWPPVVSLIPFFAIYIWYLPSLHHPWFILTVPFFHSLQYLPFVWRVIKNKALEKSQRSASPIDRRRVYWLTLATPILFSLIAGGASFVWIPEWLDRKFPIDNLYLGGTLFVFSFDIFINIHHYFIDNLLWRKTNAKVAGYLIK